MNRHRLILAGLLVLAAGALIGWRALFPVQPKPPISENPTSAVPVPLVEAPKDPAGAEVGIKKITEEYAKAFNAGDAKAATALWTADGEYVDVDGETVRGRAAIEKSLAEHFKAYPKSTIKIRVESVRVIGRQTALAEGAVELSTPGSAAVSVTRYSTLHVAQRIFQLAMNKYGIIRGNYYDAAADTTFPVSGALDKKTQRVAWSIGDKKDIIFEAGMSNLLKSETPVLIHYGKENTQQMTPVHLKEPQQGK